MSSNIKDCGWCGEPFIPERSSQKNCKRVHYNTCDLCHKPFEATQQVQRFCKRKHMSNCKVCGVNIEITNFQRPQITCGRKCGMLYAKEKGKDVKYNKECEFCGEKFITNEHNKIYCDNEHTKECEVCGDVFIVPYGKLGRPSRTCGQSCGSSLSHSEESRAKRIENSLKKYGTEHVFQAQEIVDKIKGSLDKSDKDMRVGSKRFNKLINDKYGVDNVSKLNHIKEMKEKTYMNKYGVSNPMLIGMKNYDDYKEIEKFLKNTSLSVVDIAEYFNLGVGIIRSKIKEFELEDLFEGFYTMSMKETEFNSFINKSSIKNIEKYINMRELIEGKEIDFYFPEANIGVEISPTYTHNSRHGWGGVGEGKSKDYHKNKFKLGIHDNLELITIFDWHNWENILHYIENRIISKLNNPKFDLKYEEHITNIDDVLEDFNNVMLYNENEKYNKISIIKKDENIVDIYAWDSISDVKLIASSGHIPIKHSIIELLSASFIDRENLDSIMIKNDNSFGYWNKYEELSLDVKSDGEPLLHYCSDSGCMNQQYISPKTLTKENIDDIYNLIDDPNLLPIYDCGHSEWQITKETFIKRRR